MSNESVDMGVAVGWSEIKGRGRLASFAPNDLPAGFMGPAELLGKVVRIDNQTYTVKGVEHFAIVCPSPPFRPVCTHPFGLLVEYWCKPRTGGYEIEPRHIPSIGLTRPQLDDLRLRLNTAKADLIEMYANCSPFTEGHARLQGKAQGIGLALSYLEEYVR